MEDDLCFQYGFHLTSIPPSVDLFLFIKEEQLTDRVLVVWKWHDHPFHASFTGKRWDK